MYAIGKDCSCIWMQYVEEFDVVYMEWEGAIESTDARFQLVHKTTEQQGLWQAWVLYL